MKYNRRHRKRVHSLMVYLYPGGSPNHPLGGFGYTRIRRVDGYGRLYDVSCYLTHSSFERLLRALPAAETQSMDMHWRRRR